MQRNGDKQILVIGSYNVGFICRTPRMPVWGETLLGEGFDVVHGGKGANQAVAAARLGGNVTFVGNVGNDDYGRSGMKMLQSESVSTNGMLMSDEAKTGVGFVFLNEHGDNCIIVDPGANHLLSPEHTDAFTPIQDADIVVFQLENRIDTIKRAMEIAHAAGKTVILNPAPAKANLDDLLKLATIVTPNESELLIMSGLEASETMSTEQCEQLARALLDKGPEIVIVTRGEQGAMLVSKEDGALSFPAPKVEAVDTTGAGDSFTGALSVAIAEGETIRDAVRFACYVGAYCVTINDVIPALPTREQLRQFIQSKEAAQ